MSPEAVLELIRRMLLLVVVVSGPLVATALVVGLIVSLLQAMTQVQEQSLTFVPKAIAVATALLIAGGWMLRQLAQFAAAMLGGM